MLKFIKNLSMLSTTLDALQNANAIEVLVELLSENINEMHIKVTILLVVNLITFHAPYAKPSIRKYQIKY